MLVVKNVRLPAMLCEEIEQQAGRQDVNFSAMLRELLTLGLRVKRHMEASKEAPANEESDTPLHLKLGASSAIETLYLLRKMANHMDENWVKEAHALALAKVNEIQEK